MTDETPKDQAAEEVAAPASAAQGEEDSQEFVSMARFEAFGEKLVKQIDDAAKANRQSQSDTIEHRVTESVTSALAAALQPKESPPTPDPEPESPPQEEAPADAPQPSGLEAEITGILEKHGLEAETPELVAYMEENVGKEWWEVGSGFDELAEQLAGRESNIQAGPGTGAAPRPDLEQEYIGKIHELRVKVGKGEIRKKAVQDANDALRQEYYGKGVDVDSIVFGLDGSITKQRQEDIAS